MLIDNTYFASGPRCIQNATAGKMPNAGALAVMESIMSYIRRFQRPFLHEAAGVEIGERLHQYAGADSSSLSVKNSDYDVICDLLREPFADYVFFHILRDSVSQPTMFGLVQIYGQNEHVAPLMRQVSIWNDMCKSMRQFHQLSQAGKLPVSGITVSENLLTFINSLNL